MKRDMDLVRELLLAIEASPEAALMHVPDLPGRNPEAVVYHVRMLRDVEWLTAIDATTMEGENYFGLSLTWPGHEFLETVRDPEIWSTTKTGAAKVGSWSLGLLADLSKAAIVAKATSLGLL